MQRLGLSDCQTVDLSAINRCKGLHELSINSCRGVTGMGDVGRLSSLQVLALRDVHIITPDLAFLEKLSQLEVLDLYRTRLSTRNTWNPPIEDLSHLSGLANLRRLDLSQLRVSDIGPLGSLTRLVYLDLRDNSITDAGLDHLKGLTSLRDLYLDGTQVTNAGVKKLKEALPYCIIRR